MKRSNNPWSEQLIFCTDFVDSSLRSIKKTPSKELESIIPKEQVSFSRCVSYLKLYLVINWKYKVSKMVKKLIPLMYKMDPNDLVIFLNPIQIPEEKIEIDR